MGNPRKAANARCERLTLCFRSPHVDHLRQAAAWGETSLSKSLARIIERFGEMEMRPYMQAAVKDRLHVTMPPQHIAILDALALQWGLTRSEVAQRLIERAEAEERASSRVASVAGIGRR